MHVDGPFARRRQGLHVVVLALHPVGDHENDSALPPILVVDDNEANLLAAAAVLEPHGPCDCYGLLGRRGTHTRVDRTGPVGRSSARALTSRQGTTSGPGERPVLGCWYSDRG